jgi:hypothetical protein
VYRCQSPEGWGRSLDGERYIMVSTKNIISQVNRFSVQGSRLMTPKQSPLIGLIIIMALTQSYPMGDRDHLWTVR